MKTENIKVEKLVPYSRNTKKHEETQISNVAESIKQFGFVQPLVVDKDNVVVIGHCRLLAAKKLGMQEVPCVRVDNLTKDQVKALRILDNKTNESEWDWDLLVEELDGLDLTGFDLDFGIVEETQPDEVVEIDAPPLPKIPKSKLGEIYQLGQHRLMCGDATSEADMMKLMDGDMADMVLTDPPYNVNITGGTDEKLKIENDNMDKEAFYEFIKKAFENMALALKSGGGYYIWHASRTQREFENALNDSGMEVREQLIWVKNTFTLGRQDYQWQHELCFYGWKDGHAHYFIEDRTQPTIIEDRPDTAKMKKEELKAMLDAILAEHNLTTILREDKPTRSELHPTMKPIKLCARLIFNSSKPKEIVLDMFGGSGSTLIACEQLDRKCYMMEYDPHYVDVIIERWEEFTGEKAVLL